MTDRRDWRDVIIDRVVSAIIGALFAAIVGLKVTGDKLNSMDVRLARIETFICTQNTNCPR